MTRIILNLSDSEQEVLYRKAAQEYRPPRDHARLLLMRALGFIDGEVKAKLKDSNSMVIYDQTSQSTA